MNYKNMRLKIQEFESTINDEKLKKTFDNCFYNTLDTTVKILSDNSSYVFTGDISAMWLRDSSAQVIHYMQFINEDEDVKKLIKGLIKRQLFYISIDPYANAFNEEANNFGHKGDITDHNPWVWERKFEIDSLCYPIFLAYNYYKISNDLSIFDQDFKNTVNKILNLFVVEQNHHENSKYIHYRPSEEPYLSVPCKGKGGAVSYTGMIWSGYRPSDDPCEYGYLVPGNMFAIVILKYLEEIFSDISVDHELFEKALKLKEEIDNGIQKYAIVNHATYGEIYAYEVDGLGNHKLMDDANVPSLLSLPYLGYVDMNDALYQNTRRFILSKDNKYYYEGKYLKGIGSPHTPENHTWPISVIMQGLTSDKQDEINNSLKMLLNSDAGKMLMHEGVNVDNPEEFSREWFAWANSLFAYFIIKKSEYLNNTFITK
jgi:meiotically up-regulated gene 157 (Mug157) protein